MTIIKKGGWIFAPAMLLIGWWLTMSAQPVRAQAAPAITVYQETAGAAAGEGHYWLTPVDSQTTKASQVPMPKGSAGPYRFTLKGNARKTLTLKTAGEAEMAGMVYRHAGVYTYRLEGRMPGGRLSPESYTVSVVAKNTGSGLTLQVVAATAGGQKPEAMVFRGKAPAQKTAAAPKRPKTGDSSDQALWLVLLGGGAAGMTAAIAAKRRKTQKNV